MRRLLPFALLLVLGAAHRAPDRGVAGAAIDLMSIAVAATPVPLSTDDPALTRAGRLRFMGGLQLRSPDPRFGGLSGLRWLSPGKLIAITDGGQWVTLDVEEAGGRLVGLNGTHVGLVRGPLREPMKGKAHADAEALEVGDDGLTVAFETDARVWHYRAAGGAATSDDFPDADWLKRLPPNKGIEAMARLPGGWLYLAEEVSADGAHEGVIAATGRLTGRHARVRLRMPAGYVPTDAQALDEGHVLVVGRRFSLAAGMSAVVVSVPVDVAAMTVGAPTLLATLSPPLSVDNMEGLTIAREGGRTFVYLCSDDNFSPIQRTLLMKFELLGQ